MTGVNDWDKDTNEYTGKIYPGVFGRCDGCCEWCLEEGECPYLEEVEEDTEAYAL